MSVTHTTSVGVIALTPSLPNFSNNPLTDLYPDALANATKRPLLQQGQSIKNFCRF